jgi:hypothetical protein
VMLKANRQVRAQPSASCGFPQPTVQSRPNQVEFDLLCRPPDYADLGVRSRRLGDDYQPGGVGIIAGAV